MKAVIMAGGEGTEISPAADGGRMEKIQFLNTYVNNVSMDETITEIDKLISKKQKSYIVAVNVDVIIKIENDKKLKQVTDEADMVLVDGQPLIWISKWYRRPIKERVSGSDLVPVLCGHAVKKGYSVFLIGGKDGVAEKAEQNLKIRYKGIKIAGTYSPPFGFEKDINELSKINKMITERHPDILIVCFGCPKQEKWIYDNYKSYGAIVSVCAGATVDFLAGNIKRAPRWMSDHGFEWLYRFFQEPKRLFKRYFIDDMKIFGLIAKYK